MRGIVKSSISQLTKLTIRSVLRECSSGLLHFFSPRSSRADQKSRVESPRIISDTGMVSKRRSEIKVRISILDETIKIRRST